MKNEMNKTKRYFFRSKYGIIIMASITLFAMIFALRFGSSAMNIVDFCSGMFGKNEFETETIIIYSVRLPRIIGSLLAGVGLSVSGVLLQSVTGNDLASPNIIGVNAGAGFMVILFLWLFPMSFLALPFVSFVGALLTTLLIVSLANKINSSKSTIILAGIAFTALLNALISFISMLDSDVLTAYNYFSIGGLSGLKITKLIIPAIIIFVGVAFSLAFSRQINLLCLGDNMAVSLGVKVKPLRIICLICASACASAVVSFAGLLGFVGLVVPHISRKIVGNDTKYLIITSALVGATLVTIADLLGRILFAPSEIPVGIIMAIVGAPFFFVLLLKRRKNVAI